MHHVHLKECRSTQDEVKRAISENPGEYLISTDHQSQGVGRQGSQWIHFSNALAFSFTLKPNEEITLTPLEIGILLAKFFKPKVLIKWPNDLLNEKGEKLGGILCQLVNKQIIVGIGLNLKMQTEDNPYFPYPVNAIFNESELDSDIKQKLPPKIVDYILHNRLSPEMIHREFNQYCSHLHKEVEITNNSDTQVGLFTGISNIGEALIVSDGEIKKVLTGSLRLKK
jgi:biotin-[acetyl-CoA-carboxylase] ligase BirA-like protein